MKIKSLYFTKKAERSAAIQNLRRHFRQNMAEGGTRADFATRMGMSLTMLNQYLTGIYEPRPCTVEKWALRLGVSHEQMMTADFEFVPYPIEDLVRPKSQSRHVTKREWRQSFDDMIDEYVTMANEGEVEYNSKIVELMKRYKI